MDLNNAAIQALLVTLIQVLVPILLGVAIAGAKKLLDQVKLNVDQKTYDYAWTLASELVKAAEQNGLNGYLAEIGMQKKDYVLQQLDTALKARGIKLDLKMLSDLIEAQVYEQFHKAQ